MRGIQSCFRRRSIKCEASPKKIYRSLVSGKGEDVDGRAREMFEKEVPHKEEKTFVKKIKSESGKKLLAGLADDISYAINV